MYCLKGEVEIVKWSWIFREKTVNIIIFTVYGNTESINMEVYKNLLLSFDISDFIYFTFLIQVSNLDFDN